MHNSPRSIDPSDNAVSRPSRSVLQVRSQTPTKTSPLDIRGLQTSPPPAFNPGAGPPLLPAFLITGLFVFVVVALILWRNCMERRRRRRMDEVDLLWPGGEHREADDPGPPPTLWEVEVERSAVTSGRGWDWGDIMPASLRPLYAPPKPRGPRWLIPREKDPEPYWKRMMGGAFGEYGLFYRTGSHAAALSQRRISTTAPSSGIAGVTRAMDEDLEEEELPIDRFEVAVFIAYPKPRRKTGGETSNGNGEAAENGDSVENEKKPINDSHDHDPVDEGPSEFSFGTVILPYAEES
ncbi:hypothetical protein M422DRAFT_783580 [Sphaerobolus stellatus SS14]|uniref:Uncharacterized protein n=1 Tax=Sphaerobolus stellatus (strain SS14) TaxID=990650 RepID=A0A0C9USI0_SPHS4|nr:hypothetical protein M422DRAFT_783580 [Sphaerobolus stellatus SS14]